MNSIKQCVGLDEVESAAEQINAHVIRTPLIFNDVLSRTLNCEVHLKAENLQHEGSFKIRGATNAVLSYAAKAKAEGVIAHSSGNHAAALARAARVNGIKATIVMPHNSSKRKLQSVRDQGITPVLCDPSSEARQAMTDELIASTNAHLIHAYDDPLVIAGQGTVGLEIHQQLEGVDTVLVPVGGGGLLSGTLIALKSLKPNIKVFGCEPSWADDAFRSLSAGAIQLPTRYDTIADGLRTSLGGLTFPIIKSLVDGILLVDEQEIRSATRQMVTETRMVAEPSGAVTLAALNRYSDQFRGEKVAVVISGGNLDMGNCKL